MSDFSFSSAVDLFNPPTCKKCGVAVDVRVKYGWYDEVDIRVECLRCGVSVEDVSPFVGVK